jgi:hypothetical protein
VWSAADLLLGELLPVPSKTGADQPKLPGVRCRVYACRCAWTGVGVLFPALPDEQLGSSALRRRGPVVEIADGRGWWTCRASARGEGFPHPGLPQLPSRQPVIVKSH